MALVDGPADVVTLFHLDVTFGVRSIPCCISSFVRCFIFEAVTSSPSCPCHRHCRRRGPRSPHHRTAPRIRSRSRTPNSKVEAQYTGIGDFGMVSYGRWILRLVLISLTWSGDSRLNPDLRSRQYITCLRIPAGGFLLHLRWLLMTRHSETVFRKTVSRASSV